MEKKIEFQNRTTHSMANWFATKEIQWGKGKSSTNGAGIFEHSLE